MVDILQSTHSIYFQWLHLLRVSACDHFRSMLCHILLLELGSLALDLFEIVRLRYARNPVNANSPVVRQNFVSMG